MSKSEALEIIDKRLGTIRELISTASDTVTALKMEIRSLRDTEQRVRNLRQQVINETKQP